jgi:hypothetical protein
MELMLRGVAQQGCAQEADGGGILAKGGRAARARQRHHGGRFDFHFVQRETTPRLICEQGQRRDEQKLRRGIADAEISPSECKIDEFDILGALPGAGNVLENAEDVWMAASLDESSDCQGVGSVGRRVL